MKVFMVLGHPGQNSFNHALADAITQVLRQNGHQVICHDLYQEGFDPVLDERELMGSQSSDATIKRHCDELSAADGIIVIHPNWWGQPPAIVKGWVDRVLRPGVGYTFVGSDARQGTPTGLLKGKVALVINTSNVPHERELAAFGDPLEAIWKKCVFGLCGVENFHRTTYSVVFGSSYEERQGWLEDARRQATRCFPAPAS